jgi:Holliday junction resolvase RusA-like endonuclease
MDNAMKSLFDALVPAGFIPADSMTYMRELWVTVDDKRLGTVAVEAIPLGKEAA